MFDSSFGGYLLKICALPTHAKQQKMRWNRGTKKSYSYMTLNLTSLFKLFRTRENFTKSSRLKRAIY